MFGRNDLGRDFDDPRHLSRELGGGLLGLAARGLFASIERRLHAPRLLLLRCVGFGFRGRGRRCRCRHLLRNVARGGLRNAVERLVNDRVGRKGVVRQAAGGQTAGAGLRHRDSHLAFRFRRQLRQDAEWIAEQRLVLGLMLCAFGLLCGLFRLLLSLLSLPFSGFFRLFGFLGLFRLFRLLRFLRLSVPAVFFVAHALCWRRLVAQLDRVEVTGELGDLFLGARIDEPHHQEERHHRGHEIRVGDFPNPAVMAAVGFRRLFLYDDSRGSRFFTLLVLRHGCVLLNARAIRLIGSR